MRSFRVGPARPALKLQCAARTASKVAPRFNASPKIVASGAIEDFGLGSDTDFHPSIKVPTSMAMGSSGAGGLMEKSKLSFKQSVVQKGPSMLEGGGDGIPPPGGKIGGDGGGGDDEDDDDYFNEGGDGDEADDTVWWHKKPLAAMYDAVTVKAVLSEWCLTVEGLPNFLQMLASMQYYSSAQWVRYLTIQERPSLFRAVERSLARFPDARSGFVGRMLADPAFMQKAAMEGGLAFTLSFLHELHVRGRRITNEMDYALINAFCMGAGAAVCSGLVAPSKTPTPPSSSLPWQSMLNKLPNNAFEKNTPARSFEIPQRVTGFVAKGVELSAVYAIAGGASAALQNCIVAARRAKDASYSPVTPVPGISRAAGGMGVFGGLAANSRLQAVAGLDRVLFEYVKVNTLWQVVGISTVARTVSQLVLEDPWAVGASARCSRAALQGSPVTHVPTPEQPKKKTRKVRKLVKRRIEPAEAGFQMSAAAT